VTAAPRELAALNDIVDQLLHLANAGADAEVKANLFAAVLAERYPAMAAD
jgi:hypothetical protein